MWTLQNLEDVKSDLSVFHRIDDISTMAAPTFFSRVERLGFYEGAVQMRARIEKQKEEARFAPSQTTYQPSARTGRQEVPESVMLAQHEADGWAERG